MMAPSTREGVRVCLRGDWEGVTWKEACKVAKQASREEKDLGREKGHSHDGQGTLQGLPSAMRYFLP